MGTFSFKIPQRRKQLVRLHASIYEQLQDAACEGKGEPLTENDRKLMSGEKRMTLANISNLAFKMGKRWKIKLVDIGDDDA